MLNTHAPLCQLRSLATPPAFLVLAAREFEPAQRRRLGFPSHRLHLGTFDPTSASTYKVYH
jgi:hypothetical protein